MTDIELNPGQLLVASSALLEPNFFRSVIFVVDHDESGTAGVILNRPSDTAVFEILPGWHEVSATPPNIFIGGPVQIDGVSCLATGTEPTEGLRNVIGNLYIADLERMPDELGVRDARIFAGYTGWTTGQLEEEIEQGSWFVVNSHPSDMLTPNPADLWRDVLLRQGPPIAMYANAPLDIRTN